MTATRTRRHLGALLATVVILTGLAACDPATTLVLTVTTTEDLVDVAPGDGVCEATTGAGNCTLRAAVMEANATPDATTVRVVLAAGASYVLTLGEDCNREAGESGSKDDLDVHRSLTVIGNGASVRTDGGEVYSPEWGSIPCDFRVFENHRGHLALTELSLTGYTLFGQGGALLNHSSAQLTDVAATGAALNGGVVLHNRGDLTLVRTTISGGSATGSSVGPQGGAAPWAGIWSETGSLVLLDSHVRSNNGSGFGGINRYGSTDLAGIHVASGQATILQSLVTGHRGFVCHAGGCFTVHGDGIDARVPVTLIRSTVVGNGDARDVVGGAAVEVSGSILGTCGGVVTSLGYSSDADGSCLGAGQPTDLPSTPTTFSGPLSEQPHLPAAGSAVLDSIPPGTPDLCDDAWPTDLRGAPRASGSGCDIGALERQPTDP